MNREQLENTCRKLGLYVYSTKVLHNGQIFVLQPHHIGIYERHNGNVDAKLILKPISHLLENKEEYDHILEMMSDVEIDSLDLNCREDYVIDFINCSAVMLMAKEGIDIFGFIRSGLAIDETEM